jgi:hypothetical protein
VKNPGCPHITANNALACRYQAANGQLNPSGQELVWLVISFQKARKCFRRSSGRLPAMIAALIAPIEIPATQSGRYSDEANAS